MERKTERAYDMNVLLMLKMHREEDTNWNKIHIFWWASSSAVFPIYYTEGMQPQGSSSRILKSSSLFTTASLASSKGQLSPPALPLDLPRTCILLQWGLQSHGTTGSLIIYNFYEVFKLNGAHSGLSILSGVVSVFPAYTLLHNQNWLTGEIELFYFQATWKLLCRHPQIAVL